MTAREAVEYLRDLREAWLETEDGYRALSIAIEAIELDISDEHAICPKCGRPTTGTKHDKLCGGFTSVVCDEEN